MSWHGATSCNKHLTKLSLYHTLYYYKIELEKKYEHELFIYNDHSDAAVTTKVYHQRENIRKHVNRHIQINYYYSLPHWICFHREDQLEPENLPYIEIAADAEKVVEAT